MRVGLEERESTVLVAQEAWSMYVYKTGVVGVGVVVDGA